MTLDLANPYSVELILRPSRESRAGELEPEARIALPLSSTSS